MNNYQLTGRLTTDPTYRDLPGDNSGHVVELRLAVRGLGKGARDAVDYIDVESYTMSEKGAETIAKGWLVAVSGRLEAQHWEKDGQKHNTFRVIAEDVEFLTASRGSDKD
jgi:single-stranded DNA-binding protein